MLEQPIHLIIESLLFTETFFAEHWHKTKIFSNFELIPRGLSKPLCPKPSGQRHESLPMNMFLTQSLFPGKVDHNVYSDSPAYWVDFFHYHPSGPPQIMLKATEVHCKLVQTYWAKFSMSWACKVSSVIESS